MKTPKLNRHLKIAIIGAGSIGQLTFHHLRYANKNFQLFFCDTRKPTQNCAKFLSLIKKIGNNNLYQTTYSKALFKPINKLREANIIIVTTKSYNLTNVILNIKPYLKKHCNIILFVNGYYIQQDAQKILGNNYNVYAASTTNGAFHKNYKCYEKGLGITSIGSLKTFDYTKIKQLSLFLPRTIITHNINEILLKKLSVNAIINPLTAFYKCRNGELKKHDDKIKCFCEELTPVFNKEGLNIDSIVLYNNILNVIELTSDNISSMCMDFENKKLPEFEAIMGSVIKMAQNHAIVIPNYTKLYHYLLKFYY
ncbi:MAG: ketopantoate reductase family protein [Succinivibrionaceae bacterium]